MSNQVPHFFSKTRSFINDFWNLFSLSEIYFLAILPLSLGGLFTWGYCYAFHLLHIVSGNNLLIRVLTSVTKNGISLLYVSLLGVIIIYYYSLVAFSAFRDSYFSQGPSELVCRNLVECFLSTLNAGLRSGGGIGDALDYTDPSVKYWFYRTFFDLSFFIIITTIGLNVIFGVILDSFSQLRDENEKITDNLEKRCFICNLPRFAFTYIHFFLLLFFWVFECFWFHFLGG